MSATGTRTGGGARTGSGVPTGGAARAGNGARAGRRRRRPGSPLGPEPWVVELDRFHGPLDLLLHLIRSQDIDIFDIPIARITEQFQRALETGLDELSLDAAGEFLELAATLIRIKAQLLLPRPRELEWEEDPRAELVRRLLEYEFFQEVAHVLSNAEADRARHFEKGYVEPRPVPDLPVEELQVSVEELLDAAREVPEPVPEPEHLAPSRRVTVEQKISLVREKLRRAARFAFRKLFSSWRARTHVVASLLACLELAKQQVLRLEQVDRFGEIWLLAGPRAGEEPEGEEEAEKGQDEVAHGEVPGDETGSEGAPSGRVAAATGEGGDGGP